MKKKKIVIVVLSALVILTSAAWIYFKLMHPKNNSPLQHNGKANMKNMNMTDDKEQKNMALSMPEKEGNLPPLEAQLGFLMKPTNEYVLSTIPVTSIKNNREEIEVNAFGRVVYDTREIGTISARISGRIEKLFARYRYQKVQKGQEIMEIYSPEILTAEQNLLYLLKNDQENVSFIAAAKEKILLLGMSEKQLQQVMQTQKPAFAIFVYSPYSGHIHEAASPDNGAMPSQPSVMKDITLSTEELPLKEGMYVQKGENVFSVFNPGKAWVILNFFGDKQGIIRKGSPVRIIPETAPSKSFKATIDYIEPFYRKDSKTVTARVYFNNTNLKIPIGSQVSATIFGNDTEANWLPSDAVVSLGMEKVAFIKDQFGFKAHKVIVGLTYKNSIQILSGLSGTDTVAANAQYLMDSESFIKVNE